MNDNLDFLCMTLHERKACPHDYLGGSNARIFRDAADCINELRADQFINKQERRNMKSDEIVFLESLLFHSDDENFADIAIDIGKKVNDRIVYLRARKP